MKTLSSIYQMIRNLGMSFYRFYLFLKNNRKLFTFIIIFFLGMKAGEYRETLQTFLGHNYEASRTGQNVRVTGDCLFYNGARVTLAGDQMKVVKNDKERVYGIVIGMGKSVSCMKQNVVVEPYTYAQFLVDGDRPTVKLDENRIVETDPELALVKKTILVSGTCKDVENKTINLKGNLAEVLSVVGDFDRRLNIFLVTQSKTVTCDSKLMKARLVRDEDVSTIEEDERNRANPKGPVTLVGKMVEVSGSCTLINPTNKKEITVPLRGQPVLVLGVEKEGETVMMLRGSTAYDKYDAIPIKCDRNKEPDIIWEITDKAIVLSSEAKKSSPKVLITGTCLLEDGSKYPLFEQEVKVSEMNKSDGTNVDKVVGFIKIDKDIKKVSCDKKNEKSLLFDVK